MKKKKQSMKIVNSWCCSAPLETARVCSNCYHVCYSLDIISWCCHMPLETARVCEDCLKPCNTPQETHTSKIKFYPKKVQLSKSSKPL